MAVLRQVNWLGQERVDVPSLRAIESGVDGDFDCLAGNIIGCDLPLVVTGFAINITGAIGGPLAALQLLVAGSSLININATVSGSIFQVPSTQAPEVLAPGVNPNVQGSWTIGNNYVGIDLNRTPSDASQDVEKFIDPNTFLEISETVDTALTLNYVINISTQPFETNPNLVPVAIVNSVDGVNTTSIIDARPMLDRLANGGSHPGTILSYGWPQGRNEATNINPFQGGDKAIPGLTVWQQAAMSRVFEIGGGEYWYSATADRNVTMVSTATPFASGDYFSYSGTTLTWKQLMFLFDNSTGYYNIVSAGSATVPNGSCVYVDLIRTTSGATLTAHVSVLASLGTGTPPGSRQVLAWVEGGNAYSRGSRWPVGNLFAPATTASNGIVTLFQTPGSASNPVVLNLDVNNTIAWTGATSGVGYTSLHLTGGTSSSASTAGGIGLLVTPGTAGAGYSQLWGSKQASLQVAVGSGILMGDSSTDSIQYSSGVITNRLFKHVAPWAFVQYNGTNNFRSILTSGDSIESSNAGDLTYMAHFELPLGSQINYFGVVADNSDGSTHNITLWVAQSKLTITSGTTGGYVQSFWNTSGAGGDTVTVAASSASHVYIVNAGNQRIDIADDQSASAYGNGTSRYTVQVTIPQTAGGVGEIDFYGFFVEYYLSMANPRYV